MTALPRVAYLRGSYLNPFEVQYVAPLQDEFEIEGIATGFQRHSLSQVKLPMRVAHGLEDPYAWIPRGVPNLVKMAGFEGHTFGMRHLLRPYCLVHTAEALFYFSGAAARERARRNDLRLVVQQAEVIPFLRDDNPFYRARKAFVHRLADLFLPRTEMAAKALAMEGVSRDRMRVVGHGVDVDRFSPGPRDCDFALSIGIPEDALIVLFIGDYNWEKGVYSLIYALAEVLRTHRGQRPVHGLLVGRGRERPALARLAAKLGIADRVHLHEHVPYDRIPDMHRLADIFVLPSISTRTVAEQFGIVLIEAMASGSAVIGTYCGAISEVIGNGGVLTAPNEFVSLAREISSLLSDEDRRKTLGTLARRRAVEQYSSTHISSLLRSAYREVLAR